jgi:2-oxoglutarate ferredoxin oxidoreductase subunit beta
MEENLNDTHQILGTTQTPLNSLTEKELCPGDDTLQQIVENYR